MYVLCFYGPLLSRICWSTPTLIGLAAQTPESPLPGMRSSWAITWSPGHPSVRMQSLARVPRPSIGRLPMPLPRSLGCANSLLSCTFLCVAPPLFTVITSALFICLRTPFSISAPNTWRLIYTLFVSALLPVMSAFFTFRRALSTPTSSPKACLLRCSRSSGPV